MPRWIIKRLVEAVRSDTPLGEAPEVGALSSCVCPPQCDGIANAPLGDLAKLVASGYSPIKIKKPPFWSRALTKGSACEKHEFAAPS
jgi:hypothetical protein